MPHALHSTGMVSGPFRQHGESLMPQFMHGPVIWIRRPDRVIVSTSQDYAAKQGTMSSWLRVVKKGSRGVCIWVTVSNNAICHVHAEAGRRTEARPFEDRGGPPAGQKSSVRAELFQ